MFVKFLIVFLLVVTGNCFILDGTPSNGGQIQTPNQFLTVTEFLLEKKTLQQETNSLRRDLDKTISLLDTQLKQKFDLLEHKVAENTQKNDSNLHYVPMDMYLSLEQKFNKLQIANSVITKENSWMKTELQLLQNASLEHDRIILDLQQIGNIKPLQEIGTLQLSVQTNTATIQSLSMNERARSQDFIALYNLTMESKNTNNLFKNDINNQLTSIQINQNSTRSDLNSEMEAAQKNYNLTVDLLEGKLIDMNNKLVSVIANHSINIVEVRHKIEKTEKLTNSTILSLKKRMDDKVALTAHCSSSGTVSAGNIIKFSNVAFSEGVNNLSIFKSSGKFVCETPGLYLIAVSVATRITGDPEFSIYLNGNKISRTEIGSEKTTIWRGGTGIVSRQLVVNDGVWVQADSNVSPETGLWSQFTIVKIN